MAFAAFSYRVHESNCCRRAECRYTSVVGPSLGCSVVVGESCSRPARVSRGSVTMSKTTHTANSPEPGSWMETVPPEGRAAAVSEAAPPPNDFPRGGAWGSATTGDLGAERTTSGFYNPNWLESDAKGMPEHNDLLRWDTATWTAASPVDFQSLGTRKSAPTGDVGANYTTATVQVARGGRE